MEINSLFNYAEQWLLRFGVRRRSVKKRESGPAAAGLCLPDYYQKSRVDEALGTLPAGDGVQLVRVVGTFTGMDQLFFVNRHLTQTATDVVVNIGGSPVNLPPLPPGGV